MPQIALCRLCLSSCAIFKSLIDDSGQVYEVYEITVKYFDPKILQPKKKHDSSVICLVCWQHIKGFHAFQQSVLKAQTTLELTKQPIVLVKFKDKNQIIQSKDEPKVLQLNELPHNDAIQLPALDMVDNKNNIIPVAEETYKCKSCQESFKNIQFLEEHKSKYVLSSCIRQKLLAKIATNNEISKKVDDLSNFKINSTISIEETTIPKETFQKYPQQSTSCFENYLTNDTIESSKIQTSLKRKLIENSPTDIVVIKTRTTLQNSMASTQKTPTNDTTILPKTSCTSSPTETLKENNTISNECIGELECVLCQNIFENYTLIRQHFQTKHPEEESQILCSKHDQNNRFKIMAQLLKLKYVQLHFRNKATENQITKEDNQQKSNKNVSSSLDIITEINKTLANNNDIGLPLEISKNPTTIPYNLKNPQHETLSLHKRLTNYNDDFIAKWRSKLECVVCKDIYTKFSVLKEHFKIKHSYLECYIVCCNLKLKETLAIVGHIRDFHNEIVSSRQIKKVVKKNEKYSRPWKCFKCNSWFKNFRHFGKHDKKNHPRVPPNQRNSEKDVQNRKQNRKSNNREAILPLVNINLIENETSLDNDNNLNQSRTNNKIFNISKYKCQICSIQFDQDFYLRKHIFEMHRALFDDELLCKQCYRGFKCRLSLQSHVKAVHSNVKWFCDYCNKTFKLRSGMERHQSKVHSELLLLV